MLNCPRLILGRIQQRSKMQLKICHTTTKSILPWGSIFVNPFLSKSIFIISYLDLIPRMQMITPYKSIKSSIEEPSCSTSLSNEEEEGTKSEESSNPSACSSILTFFVFSSRIFCISNYHSTYSMVFTLSTFQSASLLSMGHKGRVRTRRATTNKNISNTKYRNNYY